MRDDLHNEWQHHQKETGFDLSPSEILLRAHPPTRLYKILESAHPPTHPLEPTSHLYFRANFP